MSNRESKIAISKAALCYGFAIALRALFIGDSLQVPICHCERPLGRAAINEQENPTRLIASLTLAMTKNGACKIFLLSC